MPGLKICFLNFWIKFCVLCFWRCLLFQLTLFESFSSQHTCFTSKIGSKSVKKYRCFTFSSLEVLYFAIRTIFGDLIDFIDQKWQKNVAFFLHLNTNFYFYVMFFICPIVVLKRESKNLNFTIMLYNLQKLTRQK